MSEFKYGRGQLQKGRGAAGGQEGWPAPLHRASWSTALPLWVNSAADTLVIFSFFFFPRKQVLIFHANYLQKRQVARNVKTCFQGKIFQNVIC